MNLFDENGNATETHTVTVSGFDATTGEFMNTYDVRIFAGTGIPGFSTLTLAPAAEKGFASCWDGKQWYQIIDLRGSTAYEKATGAAVMVKNLGALDEALTSVAPATQFDKWDGSEWVTDAVAAQAAAIANAELQRSALLAHADNVMIDWRTELQMGSISADDKSKLAAWLEYKKEVKAVDVSTAYSWPTQPEP